MSRKPLTATCKNRNVAETSLVTL